MSRSYLLFATVLLLIASNLVSGRFATTPAISGDFTANVTILEGTEKSTGYIVSHTSGHRWFRFIKELNETTYTFQPFGRTFIMTFTIMNSGCTCQRTDNALIPNMFDELSTATSGKGTCAHGASGQLFENNMVTALPGVPSKSYCVSGSTPSYALEGATYTMFSNFVAGVPKSFPFDTIAPIVNECANACL